MTTPESEIPATRESTDLPLRLAAVDDHPYVLKGILWTLRELAPWITVITTAGSVAEMLDNGGAAADVVLLDLDLGVPQADEESDPTHNVHTILQARPTSTDPHRGSTPGTGPSRRRRGRGRAGPEIRPRIPTDPGHPDRTHR